MKVGEPFIINLACTGVIPTKTMTPRVPVTHGEIIDDIAKCMELGIQMVHLHARDASEIQTGDPEPYGRLIEAIRNLPGGQDLIVCVTTSGRSDPDFEPRSRVLDLDGNAKPDMGSLTLSSLNFVQSASINAPDTIRQLAQRMQERNIKPELEVFDIGMANFVSVLAKEGLIQAPYYVNVLLGNIAGAQADLIQLASILAALPMESVVSIAGLGKFQLGANSLGLLFADGVRVGVEDNIWMDQAHTEYASNQKLVERIITQAAILERPTKERLALRKQLDILY